VNAAVGNTLAQCVLGKLHASQDQSRTAYQNRGTSKAPYHLLWQG